MGFANLSVIAPAADYAWFSRRLCCIGQRGTGGRLRGMRSTRSVDLVVTDLAVIGFPDGRITLLETAPGISVAEVVAVTEADLLIPDTVPQMRF